MSITLHPAYAAGLFDGEGWFTIRRMSGVRSRCVREYQYNVVLGMTMREERIVQAFKDKYGGTVNIQKSRSEKHSPYYRWHGSRQTVENFIDDAGKFLIAKAKQAQVAERFIEMKKQSNFQSISDEKYDEYGRIFEQMRNLNEKGAGK